jgi:hypothetical protein
MQTEGCNRKEASDIRAQVERGDYFVHRDELEDGAQTVLVLEPAAEDADDAPEDEDEGEVDDAEPDTDEDEEPEDEDDEK